MGGGRPQRLPPSLQAQPAVLERRLLRRCALRAQEAVPHHQVGHVPVGKGGAVSSPAPRLLMALSITDHGETLGFPPLIAKLLGPLGCGAGR